MPSDKRDSVTGRFSNSHSVAVIADKRFGGKVGSYSIRSVDKGRFVQATRAASSALKVFDTKKK